ncbi:MAG: C40 family peptidase [Acidimicrobiales bacterium]
MKALGMVVAVVVGALALAVAALGDVGSVPSAPSGLAMAEVPAYYLALDEAAASSCPGLSCSVLAAIGDIESGFGQDDGPSTAGALGPMQFLPASFAAYDHPVPADPAPTPGTSPGAIPSPHDATDSVWAAARMLCANGAGTDPPGAIFAYNHSAAYVSEVLALAARYAAVGPGEPSSVQADALSFALGEVGRPYVWGGAAPGVGFDCSGHVSWAFAQAGLALPRTAQAQFDAGPSVLAGTPLVPGDLVFFGAGPSRITHVGIYDGNEEMVDAPHAGALVRTEGYRWSDYVGGTDPGSQR